MFARVEKAIDFDAVDGEPVDLLPLLPPAGADHLKASPSLTDLARSDHCRVRGCEDADGIYALLAGTRPPTRLDRAWWGGR